MTHWLIAALMFCLTAGAVCAADSKPLTADATRLDGEAVTIKAGDLEATVETNAHSGAYNGISRLVHKAQPEPVFIPSLSGFNFEHIFDGHDAGFAPRGAKLSLWRFGPDSEGLYCAADDSSWGLESMTRYTLVAPHYLDVEFTAIPHKKSFAEDYLGMFWAAYINAPSDRSINFLGRDKGDEKAPLRWITAVSPAHDQLSTSIATHEPAIWSKMDPSHWPGLAAHFSKYTFDAPFYFGRVRDMAWVYMFDDHDISDTQTVRFSQSPVGGGDPNPAWDFHVVFRPVEVGKPLTWKVRCVYKPYTTAADLVDEYTNWSGHKDIKAPAAEPQPGEQLPPPEVQMTVARKGAPIKITKSGFQWIDLPAPLKKEPGQSLALWFSAGKGGANRYAPSHSHWVYWAVDAAEPKPGDAIGMGRHAYAIYSGYRTADGTEKQRAPEKGNDEDGTSSGLVFDYFLQDEKAGEIKSIYWYGYEGQTIVPVIIESVPPPKDAPSQR